MSDCVACGNKIPLTLTKTGQIVQLKKKYCSLKCARKTWRIKYPRTHRHGPFLCNGCGKEYLAKDPSRNKYCSRKCYYASVTKKPKPKIVVLEIEALRRIKREVAKQQSQHFKKTRPIKRVNCWTCGTEMIARTKVGGYQRYCDLCQQEKRIEGRKAYIKNNSEKIRNIRRKSKSVRRARMLGVEHEPIDPFRVFDADGWKCQMCGIKTPKSKRGTYDNNAPELDHIIPLSIGGTHTYMNVQCLCRKCNQTKSASEFGQMKLFV